jgi:hypothetical protein
MVGRRWDTDIANHWDFSPADWEQSLRQIVAASGGQRSCTFIDYFVFTKELFQDAPPLVIGRVWWDNWLIWKARSEKATVVDATRSVTAVHQNHDYSYHPWGATGVWGDELAQRNRQLAGGQRHFYSIEDATHRLTSRGIERHWGHSLMPWKRALTAACYSVWFSLLGLSRPLRHRLGLRQGFLARAAGKSGSPGL